MPMHVVHAYFVAILLSLGAVLAYLKLRDPKQNVLPQTRLSIANIYELLTEFILNVMKGVMGEQAPKFLPIIGAVFFFVLFSNLLALIPGFLAPTSDINTNLAVGLSVFLYYQFMGFKQGGWAYLKHFMGPVWWLAPLFFVIEMISHVVRPISLSLRLFGNMTGDHLVYGIFSNLVPIGVPIIFLILGLMVCFIQAFVFTLLSMVYISLATAHDDHH